MPRIVPAATGAGVGPAGALVGGQGGGAVYPVVSSDSASKFIPSIWSNKLIQVFYPSTVFGEIASVDYQGELRNFGDSVIIRNTPTMTINDYQIGKDLHYETPQSVSTELLIDRGKDFSFAIEDVERFQADIDLMTDWAEASAEQMKVEIDRDLLAAVFPDAHASNQGNTAGALSGDIDLGAPGTPFVATKANIIDKIIEIGVAMDEQNIPEQSRWIVLPAWMCGLIKSSEFKDASITGDGTSIARNGRLGTIDRMTLYSSNLLNTAPEGALTAVNIIAGHRSGISFAAQMADNTMVHIVNPFKHGSLTRGLIVFGVKVIKPESLFRLYAVKG